MLVKFRTMTQDCDPSGAPLDDSARLTWLGSLLRKLSIDELPQLWNVVKGDMALVGPRPLLMEYLPLYSPRQSRRHEVRPGLTGWAQVNGRNSLSWSERLEMDVWYVENRSLALDLKILWLTLCRVPGRVGINQPGSATMERFRGNAAGASKGN
jgi:sugar transferase EpsL